jgi:ubiquinone/menaquinone biosynthesis C-methylase UbiE
MSPIAAPTPLPTLKAVADPSRLRLLRLLDRDELTVGELARCTALPQSTVSRHVAVLRRAGLVQERSEGVRSYLTLGEGDGNGVSALIGAVMGLVRDADLEHPADLERLALVRREREVDREALFDVLADDWDALRARLLGGRLAPAEVASLLVPDGLRVVDAGTGTGMLLPWLSALVGPEGDVVAVENSARMVKRAKERAAGLGNVEVRRGKIEDLPVPDGWADVVLLSLSLGHTKDVAGAAARCVRALCPGGRLIVCDVEAHTDESIVKHLGAGFAGFEPERLQSILESAGLERVRRVDLPAASEQINEKNSAVRPGRASRVGTLTPLFVAGTKPGAERRAATSIPGRRKT